MSTIRTLVAAAPVLGMLVANLNVNAAETARKFDVIRQDDGALKLVERIEKSLGDFPKKRNLSENDRLSFQPESGMNAEIYAKLAEQDFWVTSNAEGALASVYVTPKGVIPPDQMLKNVPDGAVVAKYDGSSIAQFIPNSTDMMKILSELMNNAKNAVCEMPNRPSSFGTVVDISAGFGVTGRIEFNASWDTSTLCS